MKFRDIKTLSLNCRDSARLLSEAHERRLSGFERLGLRIHLATCNACSRFRRQMDLIHDAVARIDSTPVIAADVAKLSPEAKETLRRNLIRESGQQP